MSNRLSLGFSSAEALSHSEIDWKNRLRKIGLILCVLILLGLFFGYIMRSLDAHQAPMGGSGEIGCLGASGPGAILLKLS